MLKNVTVLTQFYTLERYSISKSKAFAQKPKGILVKVKGR